MSNEREACPHCLGTGWVCEFHMGRPWEGKNACGCGGAGTNCVCNPGGNADGIFDAVFASTDPDKVKTWIQ